MRKRNVVSDDPMTTVAPFTPFDSAHTSRSTLPQHGTSYYSPTGSYPSFREWKRLPARQAQEDISPVTGGTDAMDSRRGYIGSHEADIWVADRGRECIGDGIDGTGSPPQYAPLRKLIINNPGSVGVTRTAHYV